MLRNYNFPFCNSTCFICVENENPKQSNVESNGEIQKQNWSGYVFRSSNFESNFHNNRLKKQKSRIENENENFRNALKRKSNAIVERWRRRRSREKSYLNWEAKLWSE